MKAAPASCAQLPRAHAGLQDIVTGSDGNLWFSESSVTLVGAFKP